MMDVFALPLVHLSDNEEPFSVSISKQQHPERQNFKYSLVITTWDSPTKLKYSL